jgi:N-acetylmuramoyl-L-alanine amidase
MKAKVLVLLGFLWITIVMTSFVETDLHVDANDKFVVVLDAGHGGKDPGNTGNGHYEKDIALKVVLAVGKELEKNPNFKIIYTRKTDVFLELKDRANIANKADADLFVSVHCDSHSSNAFGAGTFVLGLHANKRNFELAKKENSVIFLEDDYQTNYDGFDPNSPASLIGIQLMQEEYLDQSILLASKIQQNFTLKLKRKDRSVKQAGFWVLHNTYMPSVLVETGFLTNKNEGAYLNSKKGQQEIAIAIEEAIISYHKDLSLNTSSVASETPLTVQEGDGVLPTASLIFKVQISASSKKLPLKSYNFSGLKELSSDKKGALYRYYYGNTDTYLTAQKLKEEAVKRGYNSAFIVAFKNGQKVPLASVIKSTSN